MLIEMTASALISLNAFSVHGASDEAQFVAKQAKEARRHLYESNGLGLQRRELFEELCAVAEECKRPNWDGYGAEAVSEDAYQLAYCFLEACPPGTPRPSIGAEPDGHLTLEWYRSQHNVLSVSVSPEGDLHYSALVGPNKAYGTEAFFGEVPTEILALIRRVLPA
jgi:hypothetical protein